MSVHKDKNGKWYIKYQNKTKRGFEKKQDAKNYEAKLRLTKENLCVFKKFHDLANEYVKNRKDLVSYGSYQKSKNAIERYIIPNTKNVNINKISELDCRDFKKYIEVLDCSTIHKNYILTQYIAIFKYASEYYRYTFTPYSVVKKIRQSFEELQKRKNKEMNIWDIETFNKFITCVKQEDYSSLFTILYFTGLRLGEALALQWKDFNGIELDISKSLTRKTERGFYELKEPKNAYSIRKIKLGDYLSNYLLELKHQAEQRKDFINTWFIFGRSKPLAQVSIDRVKDKAIEKSQVNRIRIHDLRHSHASNLIANGVNIVAVSRRLGHADINMTLKIYTHLVQKNDDELISYIDSSSQNLLTDKKKQISLLD
ncbi:tyrosine-type recombinase/integrase [Anaerorhabdus sp.]|uniref:site-specific integrase n=1 Tax=Anaerorhabdus sp. TaxID=1872524 RepID=UPI002B1F9C46|nr:tyrosine-type recombinase/integrase [Anaerorhabdus sp.]MEA4875274.1 tyrosine-type recombinase/integrase [Anaerorhabdus sp.]